MVSDRQKERKSAPDLSKQVAFLVVAPTLGKPKVTDFDIGRVATIQQRVVQLQIPARQGIR
jgi:hypothetical protein